MEYLGLSTFIHLLTPFTVTGSTCSHLLTPLSSTSRNVFPVF
ncbi:MAG: hypothetical protein QT04_C0059G0029, partial [archaeon GW2011_AR11]